MNGIIEDPLGATTAPSWKGRVLVVAVAIISVVVIVRVRGSGPNGRGEAPDSPAAADGGAPVE